MPRGAVPDPGVPDTAGSQNPSASLLAGCCYFLTLRKLLGAGPCFILLILMGDRCFLLALTSSFSGTNPMVFISFINVI